MSREETGARLHRLLGMVPWIARQGLGATVEELVARFGGDERRITRDLELLASVEAGGEHGVRMWLEDGRWFVDELGNLGEPLRLTAVDGFAIVTAAKALIEVEGSDPAGPLGSALEKLRRVLANIEGLDVDLDDPPHLTAVRDAAERRELIAIEYHGAARDEISNREIEPLSVFNANGRWHVLAYCQWAHGERDFRIDRIRELRPTGEHFEAREMQTRPGVTFQPEGATPVRLEGGPAEAWVLDSYRVRHVEHLDGGGWAATVDVGGPAWFERLVLQLGPGARVVSPPEYIDLRTDVALRLLELYA